MKLCMQPALGSVPLWAITFLGREVVLTSDYDAYGDGLIVYPRGRKGKLVGLQTTENESKVCALVELDPGDPTPWDVPFSTLSPVR